MSTYHYSKLPAVVEAIFVTPCCHEQDICYNVSNLSRAEKGRIPALPSLGLLMYEQTQVS